MRFLHWWTERETDEARFFIYERDSRIDEQNASLMFETNIWVPIFFFQVLNLKCGLCVSLTFQAFGRESHVLRLAFEFQHLAFFTVSEF